MSDPRLRRWTALGGLVGIGAQVIGFVLFFGAGPPPGLGDAGKLHDYYGGHSSLILTASVFFFLGLGSLFVFVAGFRSLVAKAPGDHEWLGTVVFGLGIASLTEALISIGLLTTAVVDAAGKSDAATIRMLYEASSVLGGAPSAIPLVFYLGAAGSAIATSRILPMWSAWLGWIMSVVVLLTVPALFGGNDPAGFYTAGGLVTILGPIPLFIWTVAASIAILRAPAEA